MTTIRELSKKDSARIKCQATDREFNLCGASAVVVHVVHWDTGNTKGVSFFYRCEAHRERGSESVTQVNEATTIDWQPVFSPWRHGGWYVDNLSYPSGAVGCVSRNYPDKKWRIVCDPRPFEARPTFRNRVDAARAERDVITGMSQ